MTIKYSKEDNTYVINEREFRSYTDAKAYLDNDYAENQEKDQGERQKVFYLRERDDFPPGPVFCLSRLKDFSENKGV